MRTPNRETTRIEPTEAARPLKLHGRDHSEERIFPPALHATENPTPIQEPASTVDGIPPRYKPSLLGGELPRLTRIRTIGLAK